MKLPSLLLTLLPAPALALYRGPPVCMDGPSTVLEAGKSVVSAVIDDAVRRRCEASISFGDTAFPLIRYSFAVAPCPGRRIATFVVPAGAPNGDAFVVWRCAGLTPACSRATISGGQADPYLATEGQGDVGCISQSLSTRTTLLTVTGSSTTFVSTESDLVTLATTSFVRAGPSSTTVPDGATFSSSPVRVYEPSSSPPFEWEGAPSSSFSHLRSSSLATTSSVAEEPISEGPASTAPPLQTPVDSESVLFEVSTASRLSASLVPSLVSTLVTTLTVIRTATPTCDMND